MADASTGIWVPAKWYTNTGSSGRKITLAVIHRMEAPVKVGTAMGTAKYFQQLPSSSKASAHFCYDPETRVQCVHDKDVAYAAPGANSQGMQYELPGYSKDDDWTTQGMIKSMELCAYDVAAAAKAYGFPLEFRHADALRSGATGITTHVEVSNAWHETDHWDPGPHFPIGLFLDMCRGTTSLDLEDDMQPTDVAGEIQVAPGAFYQLTRDGGIRVVNGNGQPADGIPFVSYTVIASDGARYSFGPTRNHGEFSYPGLPPEARMGDRYFVAIFNG